MNTPRRDLGIDVIRVVALFQMVSTHYFRILPSPSPVTDALHFIGEGGAAAFFFAFGLTSHRFGSKTSGEQLTSNLLFLCVGLAHNLYLWKHLASVDFLFFLFLWRVVLSAMSSFKRPYVAWLGLSIGVMALMLALPEKGIVDSVFMKVYSGLFPFLPWGVFVLLGASYAKFEPAKPIAVALACAGVGFAALLFWLEPSRASLGISKWPLTTPYILFFTGVNVLILEGARSAQGWLKDWPRFVAPVHWLSGNLLLAAALQYVPLELLWRTSARISLLNPAQNDGSAALVAIVVGSTACLLMLVLLLVLSTRGWERVRDSGLLRRLREHRYAVAVSLLAVAAILCTRHMRDLLGSEWLATPGKPLALAALIYFALELRDWQQRRRVGDALG